jgi:predicted RNase H-like HicB family nuclease
VGVYRSLGKKAKKSRVDVIRNSSTLAYMQGKFTAIIEAAPEGGYWAICPEVPGANGQGETVKEAKDSLEEAIKLIITLKSGESA